MPVEKWTLTQSEIIKTAVPAITIIVASLHQVLEGQSLLTDVQNLNSRDNNYLVFKFVLV